MQGPVPWGKTDNFERSLIGHPIDTIRALTKEQLMLARRWLKHVGVHLPKRVKLTMKLADDHRIVSDLLTDALDIGRSLMKKATPREPKPGQDWHDAELDHTIELAIRFAMPWLVMGRMSLHFQSPPSKHMPKGEDIRLKLRPEDNKAIARSVLLSESGTPGFGDAEAERRFENQQTADEEAGRNKGAEQGSSGYHPCAWVCDANIKVRTKRREKAIVDYIRLNTPVFGDDEEGWWLPLKRLGLKTEPVDPPDYWPEDRDWDEVQPVDNLSTILMRTVELAWQFEPKRLGSSLVFKTGLPGWAGHVMASTSEHWPYALFRVTEPLFAYQWAHAPCGSGLVDPQANETYHVIRSLPAEEINRLIGLSKKWVRPNYKWVNDDPHPDSWINPKPESLKIDLRSFRKVLLKGRRKYAMRLNCMLLLMDGEFGIDRRAVIMKKRRSVLSFKVFGPVAEWIRELLGFERWTPKQVAKIKASQAQIEQSAGI